MRRPTGRPTGRPFFLWVLAAQLRAGRGGRWFFYTGCRCGSGGQRAGAAREFDGTGGDGVGVAGFADEVDSLIGEIPSSKMILLMHGRVAVGLDQGVGVDSLSAVVEAVKSLLDDSFEITLSRLQALVML